MTTVRMPSGTLLGMPPEGAVRLLVQGARVTDLVPRSPVKVPASRKVRVLAVVHGWFPALAAGSERMMQHLLDALPRDEYEIQVLSFGAGEKDSTPEQSYIYDGVRVQRGFMPPKGFVPDLIILHHGHAARALPAYSEIWPGAPVVVVHHNERYDTEDLLRIKADLNVFNTKWVKDTLRAPGIVVRPPVEPERHQTPERYRDCVTLINLQDNKGVNQFYDLADRRDLGFADFLGVIGTHGDQVLPGHDRSMHGLMNGNVQIQGTTQDMREVWSQTKVLLMPSEYESYGMCAAEASLNGIPVIAHPTPGLVECLGGSGIFIDRNDIGGYEQALRLLLTDENHYQERSALASLRGRELVSQSQRELRKFVASVRKLVRE